MAEVSLLSAFLWNRLWHFAYLKENKSQGSDEMARYDDEAELFQEDYQAGYVKNLLRL